MVSCSSIFLSRKQATWQQVAVRHHCEALRGLALEMSDGNLSEIAVAESSLAVIMMLHLFEVDLDLRVVFGKPWVLTQIFL